LRRLGAIAAVAAAVIAAAALGAWVTQWRLTPAEVSADSSGPRVKRMTDAVGMEEAPAVSPDGKDVAFVALAKDGRRQIWVRRLVGGTPFQITFDDADHEYARWTHDSSAIVYFTPAEKEGDAGALWEIPAFGGRPPRKVAPAITGADISHDGQRLATFRKTSAGLALTILSRDDATSPQMIPIQTNAIEFNPPRWSPDDQSIAFYLGTPILNSELSVIDLARPTPRLVRRARAIKGVTWLPDGDGLVFASSEGSTMVYPPVYNLRRVSPDGRDERQLTFGDLSYEQPDIVRDSPLFATRVIMTSEIWRFPVAGSPEANVRNGTQITRQTGQVQTPSVSPDGNEIAYLSDSGGHANVWIARIDGSEPPSPLTTENDDRRVVGLPIWSPVGDRIVYIRSDGNFPDEVLVEWLINRDGSDHRPFVTGSSAAWSADGQELYYQNVSHSCIYKNRVDGGAPERVRCSASVPVPAPDGTLYFTPGSFGSANKIYKAKPENDEHAVLVTSFPASRVPLWPIGFALSPDGHWIAVALKDRGTTNIFAIPTNGGSYRQVTDFGRRPILIARQVSWSKDGKFIFAALAESDADVVLLKGIVPGR
jgi:Tol biopolymer transport system component